MLVAEPEGNCLYLNQGARTLLGLGPQQAWEENIADWVHPLDRQLFRDLLQQASLQGSTTCPPLRLLNGADTWCWLSGKVVNMQEHQDYPGLALLLNQVAPPENAARPFPGTEQKLQQFSYLVSHHLRAPIANAMGLVNLLTDPQPAEELYREVLKNLKFSVWQLDAITKDINLILSNRHPSDPAGREKGNFEQVLGQVVQNLFVPLQDCQGEIVLEVSPQYSPAIPRAYLYSILYNLISAAIKYRSPAYPLRISLQCRPGTDGGSSIIFEDNGLGMQMETTEKILFRGNKKFHPGMAGRGIGLYLVKTHVESLGGLIRVLPTPEIGTRFIIQLPS